MARKGTVHKMPELVAPVGGMDRLKIALKFGADAVYLGGARFGLRAFADNFDDSELEEAIKYAHNMSKLVFVTANAYAKNNEMELLYDYFQMLYQLGADAAIIADIGVLSVARKAAPKLQLHLSTQANVSNYESAAFYHQAGAKRIVLAREMSLSEIIELKEKAPKTLEIETFVHGAMCLSMSGRCYLSSYLNNRSANRGECTQPCRWQYALSATDRQGEYMPIEEDNRGTYILNSKDLNMLAHIPSLMAAGIDAFKIEGRMKTVYYVATVVNAYRKIMDRINMNNFNYTDMARELEQTSNRGFTTGFYFDQDPNMQTLESSRSKGESEFSGVVMDYSDGEVTIEVRNKISVGDVLDILSPDFDSTSIKVDRIRDEHNCEIQQANVPMRLIRIPCEFKLSQYDILRKFKSR